jgi:hypothetical protein
LAGCNGSSKAAAVISSARPGASALINVPIKRGDLILLFKWLHGHQSVSESRRNDLKLLATIRHRSLPRDERHRDSAKNKQPHDYQ